MTRLISDSMERKITFRQKIEMRLHTMICGLCRRFQANIHELRKRARASKEQLEATVTLPKTLPAAAKARLEEAIRRQLG